MNQGGNIVSSDLSSITLILNGSLESEALLLLNERLNREHERRGGVGLAQLGMMIENVIKDSAE